MGDPVQGSCPRYIDFAQCVSFSLYLMLNVSIGDLEWTHLVESKQILSLLFDIEERFLENFNTLKQSTC